MGIASWEEIKARLRSGRFLLRLATAILLGHFLGALVKIILTAVILAPVKEVGFISAISMSVQTIPFLYFMSLIYMSFLTAAAIPIIIFVAYFLRLGPVASVLVGAVIGQIAGSVPIGIMLTQGRSAMRFFNPLHFSLLGNGPSIATGVIFGWILWAFCFRKSPVPAQFAV